MKKWQNIVNVIEPLGLNIKEEKTSIVVKDYFNQLNEININEDKEVENKKEGNDNKIFFIFN